MNDSLAQLAFLGMIVLLIVWLVVAIGGALFHLLGPLLSV
jgi:hypothetical protein